MKPSAWDLFTSRPDPTPAMLAELSQLRTALPTYYVTVTSHSPDYRYEATRRSGSTGAGPWCVISTDPADLWRELAPNTRRGPATQRAVPERESAGQPATAARRQPGPAC
jgi:hypothetical protein